MKWTKDAVQAETKRIINNYHSWEGAPGLERVAIQLRDLVMTIQADMAAEIADLEEMLRVSDKAVAETILANQ